MANPISITLRAASDGAVTASGVGSPVAINTGILDARANRSAARLTLTVLALSGASAQLKVWLETAPLVGGPWRAVDRDAFPPVTAATLSQEAQFQRDFMHLDGQVRVAWQLVGDTPGATFALDSSGMGDGAHQVYFVPAAVFSSELRGKIEIPAFVKASAAITASGKIEQALKIAGFAQPILAIDDQLRQAGLTIAAWQMLRWKGVNPDSAADRLLAEAAAEAEKLLAAIAAKKLTPVVEDSDEEDDPDGAGGFAVVSDPPRGWW